MNLNDGSGSSLEVRGAEATLLEVEPGVAVLLGDHVPAGLEVEPFGLGSHGDREIVHALNNVLRKTDASGRFAALPYFQLLLAIVV